MKNESSISLGGTIILLPLFPQTISWERKITFWVDPSPQTPLYEKGKKKHQNKSIEITN